MKGRRGRRPCGAVATRSPTRFSSVSSNSIAPLAARRIRGRGAARDREVDGGGGGRGAEGQARRTISIASFGLSSSSSKSATCETSWKYLPQRGGGAVASEDPCQARGEDTREGSGRGFWRARGVQEREVHNEQRHGGEP